MLEAGGAVDGLSQLLLVDGLKQVGEAVELEGFQCMFLVSGGEDNRDAVGRLPQRVEAETVVQLDVGNNQVGIVMGGEIQPPLLHRRDGADDIIIVVQLMEHVLQQPEVEQLVFKDQDIHGRSDCVVGTSLGGMSGKRTVKCLSSLSTRMLRWKSRSMVSSI